MIVKALNKYENFIIMVDINIDTERDKGLKQDLLRNFCDTYTFKNLIKDKTCFTKSSESSLDVIILTNKPRYFFHSQSIETGISDVHTMVSTLMKFHFTRLKTIKIYYLSYKNYSDEYFIKDLSNSSLTSNENDPDKMYSDLIQKCSTVLNKHVPLKKNISEETTLHL